MEVFNSSIVIYDLLEQSVTPVFGGFFKESQDGINKCADLRSKITDQMKKDGLNDEDIDARFTFTNCNVKIKVKKPDLMVNAPDRAPVEPEPEPEPKPEPAPQPKPTAQFNFTSDPWAEDEAEPGREYRDDEDCTYADITDMTRTFENALVNLMEHLDNEDVNFKTCSVNAEYNYLLRLMVLYTELNKILECLKLSWKTPDPMYVLDDEYVSDEDPEYDEKCNKWLHHIVNRAKLAHPGVLEQIFVSEPDFILK